MSNDSKQGCYTVRHEFFNRRVLILSVVFLLTLSACAQVGTDGDAEACRSVADQYNSLLKAFPSTPKGVREPEEQQNYDHALDEFLEETVPSALASVEDETIHERLEALQESSASAMDSAVGRVVAACKLAGIDVELNRATSDGR